MTTIIDHLLSLNEPSITYKVRVNLLREAGDPPETLRLQEAIKSSAQVQGLLAGREQDGRIALHPYNKWMGAHWTLTALADLDYPPGDESLIPLREQQLNWLFSESYKKNFPKRTVAGRVRMHPSMEGNAVYSLIKLGLADDRIEKLVQRMYDWQWPDGGWNCDMNPDTPISSFMESLIPLRALTAYWQASGDPKARQTAEQAAEIFLKRGLYKRQADGKVMDENFTKLHYPCYWHYDILFSLKVIGEAGMLDDARCQEVLDLLDSKQLPDGGYPAEKKYYRVTDKPVSGRSAVNWDGTSKRKSNPWVTVDALTVLKAAGRFSGENK